MATLDDISDILTAHTKELKLIMKNIRRIWNKLEDPEGIRAAERSKNNALNRPYRITPALAEFLGVPVDSEFSRSTVTKMVTGYIREKNLKDPEFPRAILVNNDAKLAALLNVPDDVRLTYQNIQTYLTPHYIKIETPVADAPVVDELKPEEEVAETPKPPTKSPKKPTLVKKPTKVRKPVAA